MTSTDAGHTPGTRLVLVLLACGTGASDAFAFSQLGGIFTANMTGNLVLAGLVSRPGWWPVTLSGATIATACFLTAAFAGFRIVRSARSVNASPAPRLLIIVAATQTGIAVAWSIAWGQDAPAVHLLFLAMSSASLGLQTVAAKTLAPSSGITTTFMTGTLVTAVQSLAEGRRSGVGTALTAVAALVVGAVAGGLTAAALPQLTPCVAAIVVTTAAIVATSSVRSKQPRQDPRETHS